MQHFLHFLEKRGSFWSANTRGVLRVAVAGVTDTFGSGSWIEVLLSIYKRLLESRHLDPFGRRREFHTTSSREICTSDYFENGVKEYSGCN